MTIDTMSHDQAVSSQAVERYVLGELSGDERESFEGHYFDCPDCFQQIQLDSQFLAHAREVLDTEPEKGWLAQMLGDMRRPAPMFVSALLLCALGIGTYQQVQIADARKPKVEASFFVPNDVKGAAKPISVSRKAQLSLRADFTPSSEFSSYRAQIVAESGKVEREVLVPAGETGYSITIGLPASSLSAGTHFLVIVGRKSDGSVTELQHGAFDLQFVD
jgi:hypothetical protein